MAYSIMEHNCPRCGKVFIPAAYHYYTDDGEHWCSWTCFLHRYDDKRPQQWKQVHMYNKKGVFIKTYASAAEAAVDIGIKSPNSIRECCLGKRKTSGGYVWRYERKDLPFANADQSNE